MSKSKAERGLCELYQEDPERADWDETLIWMVEEQEMEPLEPVEHELVVDYLAKHVSVEVMREKRKR